MENKTKNYTPLPDSLKDKKTPAIYKYLLIFLVLLDFYGLLFINMRPKPQAKKNTSIGNVMGVATAQPLQDENKLKNSIDQVLEGTTGSYSVMFVNLRSGESYPFHEYRRFDSASLYKLWIMATAFQQIEKNKLKEGEYLKHEKLELYKKFGLVSEADAKESKIEGTVEMSVKEALEKMITISDNDAALLLSLRVGIPNVTDFLKINGMDDSSVSSLYEAPYTNAYDITNFFRKLYLGELGNEKTTKKMLDLLKRQRLNEIMPKYLPEGTVIAHKTGQLDGVAHDAGIVFTEKGDYILVILSFSNDIFAAKERMANISKVIYDYQRSIE